jgi:hypothetical protein
MPRLVEMTWVRSMKRWSKMYRGVRYLISCRQLGTAETEEASVAAANEWWRAKKAEVDGRKVGPVPGSEEAARALLEAWAGPEVPPEGLPGALLNLIDHFRGQGLPPAVSEAILGAERVAQLQAGEQAIHSAPAVPVERTVGKLEESAWGSSG